MLLDIPLDLIRTFAVVADSPSLEKAATTLGVTQASVSLQLQRLTALIGVPLFRSEGRRKVLSQDGQRLYEKIAGPLKVLHRSLDDFAKEKNSALRTLRISCCNDTLERVMDHLHFQGNMEFGNFSREEALKGLLGDRLDLAILQDPPDSSEFIAKKLFTNQVRLVGPKGFLSGIVAEEELHSMTEVFLNLPFVGYKKNPPFLPDFLDSLQLGGLKVNQKFTCEGWRVIAKILEKNPDCWSLIPEDIHINPKQFDSILLSEKFVRPIRFYAVYPKRLKGVIQI